MAEEIGENVRALLRNCITSYERLEILLLLHRQPAQLWNVSSVEAQVYIPADRTLETLECLREFGLLEAVSSASGVLFRYAPARPDLAEAVEALAHAFKEQRATVVGVMSTNAIERVRMAAPGAFADAFILKKRKPEDG